MKCYISCLFSGHVSKCLRNKRVKICFGSWVQKVQSMVGRLHVLTQNITVERDAMVKHSHSRHCGQVVNIDRGQGQRSLENICPVKDMSYSNCNVQSLAPKGSRPFHNAKHIYLFHFLRLPEVLTILTLFKARSPEPLL